MTLDYLYIFFQSNLLEVPVFYLFYRKSLYLKKILFLVTCANLITHPVVFFGFMASPLNILVGIILAELFAWLVEAFLHFHFAKISWLQTMTASLFANLFSWQAAPWMTYWLVKIFF